MAVDYSPDETTDTPRGRGGPVWLTVDQLPDVQGRMGYFRLTEMECISLGKKLSFHLRGHAKEKGFKTVEFDEEQSAEIGDLLKVIGKQWSRLTVMTIVDLLTSRHCDQARLGDEESATVACSKLEIHNEFYLRPRAHTLVIFPLPLGLHGIMTKGRPLLPFEVIFPPGMRPELAILLKLRQ
eukprot:s7702_g1.t1